MERQSEVRRGNEVGKMTERELICKALYLIRECLINIRHSREEHNQGFIDDLNEIIVEIEELPTE